MKRLVPALFVVGLVAVPTAEAKFRIRMVLSDGSPVVGQAVDVRVHTSPVPEERFTLRLVAVPPRVGLYRALAGEETYAVRLRREGRGWRATVRFRQPGRWRLVVPNWGAPGYAIPPPIVRIVRVTRW